MQNGFDLQDPNLKGELVFVKKKGEIHPCYIPFSKKSGDSPVIATEQYVNATVRMYSYQQKQSSSTKIEARGYRDFKIKAPIATVGDFVVVTTTGANPNYAEFSLVGMVQEDGVISVRLQNITDKTAEFPLVHFSVKLIKF